MESRSGAERRNGDARRTCTQAYCLNCQVKIMLQSLFYTTDDNSDQLGVIGYNPSRRSVVTKNSDATKTVIY
jgi:hypothetical protein